MQNPKPGKIYAVGVGPGDPELVTRKAERIIRSVPVICTPTGTVDASSYALSIVEEFIDRNHQEVLVQVFPMKRDQEGLDTFWEKAAAQVAERVAAGKDVAFITIGDPFLYSTFLYLYRIFRDRYPHLEIEVVPGISSINAASIAADLPLGMASDRIAILPTTYEDEELRRTFENFDTIVLMKVSRVFDRVYALLQEMGLEKQAVFVRRVGSADEEVVTELASLVGRKLDYLSLLIVKKNLW
ncbi:cobalt-sirohydrochlorin C20-methyltransferase [Geotalea daltonii FRC-32]|uniref:Cobalt-sirohydrochlorin C20-methyltransferase n=1 Tax=Geotalea daltonii (strain DSM 22248 / JCM 15807 / FRC-32) TaxID=316067 RepID=B9M7V2_GEODF|nr:precorrin-2 C(20)-methyltransferase [Geotalea daltonii]ACM18410.1 cobalt-sirohydrochlorin C20-methyltransferase [Geotalea daltonii FRC-32]